MFYLNYRDRAKLKSFSQHHRHVILFPTWALNREVFLPSIVGTHTEPTFSGIAFFAFMPYAAIYLIG